MSNETLVFVMLFVLTGCGTLPGLLTPTLNVNDNRTVNYNFKPIDDQLIREVKFTQKRAIASEKRPDKELPEYHPKGVIKKPRVFLWTTNGARRLR